MPRSDDTEHRSRCDLYLHRPRPTGTWYARVTVPRTLVKYVGQTHIRRSLQTSSKAEANLRKHAVVGQIKEELAALKKAPQRAQERGFSLADAKVWREELKTAEAQDNDDEGAQHEAVRGLIEGKSRELERLHGTDKASRWFKAATTTGDTLADLMDRWLKVSDYKASTNDGHRKALSDVLQFVGNEHAAPGDIDPKKAIAFIDTDLTQRGLAYNTIRDRLASLGSFWAWMESRLAVPKDANPWRNHKVSKQANKGRSPEKRTYTDAELLLLLTGNEKVKAWPTYSYIPDLIRLGMFTGCRLDELCSLTAEKVTTGDGLAVLDITDSKTKAGIRPVGVTHGAALAVLARRLGGKQGAESLFPELTPGGADKKLSSSAIKAYTRYRRACGVPDGTDFHSFRRNCITILEDAGVGQVAIARFVGHKVGTMAGDTYSAGVSKERSLETSRNVRYSAQVEGAAAHRAQSGGGAMCAIFIGGNPFGTSKENPKEKQVKVSSTVYLPETSTDHH